jgi:hypothetical protein
MFSRAKVTAALTRNRPTRARSLATRRDLRFVGVLDRPLGARVEAEPGLGGREALGRPQQQADAEPLFERSDGFGDGGLADLEVARRRRERARLDDAAENLHGGHSVHMPLRNEPSPDLGNNKFPWEWKIVSTTAVADAERQPSYE